MVEQRTSAATFMELGFDSLFLTQVSQALDQRFGVRIAFADLLEKYPTLQLLAEHLERVLPPEKRLSLSGPDKAPAAEGTIRIGQRGEVKGVLAVPLTEAQKELWYATL